jgi:hypothetical protein
MRLRRILALYLSLILSAPCFAQQSGVSVQQDSAAQQNLGRVVQSPEARSPNLPTRAIPFRLNQHLFYQTWATRVGMH